MSNRSSQDELPTRSITNTQTFLQTCVLEADHKALEEHLVNNPVQQCDLDRCLLRGLRRVQQNKKELSRAAPALTILLRYGAKWNIGTLLNKQKTPYHIICESPGDHHELLDLIMKSSQQAILDARDINRRTALMCAIENANIDCIKCLLAKGADVTLEADRYQPFVSDKDKLLNPIIKAIWMTGCGSKYPSVTMSKIFDLLLEAAVERSQDHLKKCRAYILCAIITSNNRYINKLIKIGAPLDGLIYDDRYVWVVVAKKGTVELLKSMINRGFDKNSKDQNGLSLFEHVFSTGKIEAIRYLLDLGVTIPSYTPEVREEQCKEKRLIIDDDSELQNRDPYMIAIRRNNLEMLKLLDEYGSQTCKSFTALRCAVKYDNVDVTSYLLNKYTYSPNIEYTTILNQSESIYTLLTEPRFRYSTELISLLLDHGADPDKQMCSATSANAIMTATV